jgi:hypothetical protein
MVEKMKAKPWPIYKIKLGTAQDAEIIRALRKHTNSKLRVDANSGWSLQQALDLIGPVGDPPYRQELAIAPEIRGPLRQRVLAQRLAYAIEIVAHQERLAGAREIMHLIRRIGLAGGATNQIGDEGRPLGGEIIGVRHDRLLCSAAFCHAGRSSSCQKGSNRPASDHRSVRKTPAARSTPRGARRVCPQPTLGTLGVPASGNSIVEAMLAAFTYAPKLIFSQEPGRARRNVIHADS